MKSLCCFLIYFSINFSFATNIFAQGNFNYAIGLNLTGGVKLPAWGSNPKFLPFYGSGVNASLYVEGSIENSFSLLLRTGLYNDKIANLLSDNERFNYFITSAYINPQVAFPTKYYNVKILAGFGLDWFFMKGTDVEFRTFNSNRNIVIDLYESHDSIVKNKRNVIPYLSTGIYFSELPWKWGKRITMNIMLKQPLLNFFKNPTQINYIISSEKKALPFTKYYPLSLTVEVGYNFIKKLTDN